MNNKIITISREFGSGGRTIGKETAAKLGIPCFEQELIEKIAEKSGFTKEYIRECGEYAPSPNWLNNALIGRDFNGHSQQDKLWMMQTSIITDLAEKGPCVIVGQCADYILQERLRILAAVKESE